MKSKLDVSKLPQDISQSTIGAIQNESKSVHSLNRVAIRTAFETTSEIIAGKVKMIVHPLQVSSIAS